MMAKIPTRKCESCGNPFPAEQGKPAAKYCSLSCVKQFYDKKCIAIDIHFKSRPQVSAWSEMFAIQDLMRQGYVIYKPMSDAAPYSLVAIKDEVIHRVEVVVSRRTATGNFYIPRRALNMEYEILALVLPEDVSIHYHTTVDIELEPTLSAESD